MTPRPTKVGEFAFQLLARRQGHDLPQYAVHFHAHPVRGIGVRGHYDPTDQLTDQLRRLGLDLGVVERFRQRRHLGGVHLGQIGHKDDHAVVVLLCQLGFDLCLLRLALAQTLQDRLRRGPSLHHVHHMGDGLGGLSQALPEGALLGGGVPAGGLDLLLHLRHEGLHPLGGHQGVPQAGQDALLDLLAGDGNAVGAHAGAPLAVVTAVAVLADDDVAAPAFGARQQAGQQVPGPVVGIEVQAAVGVVGSGRIGPPSTIFQLGLNGIPQIIGDDAQMGHLGDLDAGLVVDAGNPLAGLGEADETGPAPHESTDI
nr:hypothetical protein [Paramagnetospirillum marisnigri]